VYLGKREDILSAFNPSPLFSSPKPCFKGLAVFMSIAPVRQIASGPLSKLLHAFPRKILNVRRDVVIGVFLPLRNGAFSRFPSLGAVRSGNENRSTFR